MTAVSTAFGLRKDALIPQSSIQPPAGPPWMHPCRYQRHRYLDSASTPPPMSAHQVGRQHAQPPSSTMARPRP